jgi:hypothetical protein
VFATDSTEDRPKRGELELIFELALDLSLDMSVSAYLHLVPFIVNYFPEHGSGLPGIPGAVYIWLVIKHIELQK